MVIKMDDELVGWVSRFAECLAINMGANLTAIHHVFRVNETIQVNGDTTTVI
jgi:hypothetical protein